MKIDITKIKPNKANPRKIDTTQLERLKKSIQEFPEMLDLRPIVVNKDYLVLGGNMRLRALLDLGYKEVPILFAESLTPEQENEFIIKDNVGFGEWDWEVLTNDWDANELTEWGLDLPTFETSEEVNEIPTETIGETDFSKNNKEIDFDEEMKSTIVLSYTSEEFIKVKTALSKLAQTPEQAVYLLLFENE